MVKKSKKATDLIDGVNEEVEEIVEDLNEQEDDGRLFPGGPNEEEIEELKVKTGGELFMTRIIDSYYLWRPLKRLEYREIMRIENADSYFREEKICEKCVVYPKNVAKELRLGRAGIATLLSEVISEESGFTNNVQSMKL
ncbi:hypothetical protein A5882_003432 [Enterococcus sp. 4E1_DIV0656]|uniref:hypothetical protein n=1 Tax=Enterococcus sp. 4E1_DIV0656 TaxID=1834180 RepID=UPI000A367E88|nr:hypothetical protein [Enterococcus sp. 4E1_DIV0656]OTO09102.1 hypothetical protein A5882_003432 [Enterococcus sp. 4E1_DIV0656]